MDQGMYHNRLFLIIPFLVLLLGIFCCTSGKDDKQEQDRISEPVEVQTLSDESSLVSQGRIEELEKRFQLNPRSYTSASDLANAYSKLGELEKALNVLDEFITKSVGLDVERAKIDRALLLSVHNRVDEAYMALLILAEAKDCNLCGEAYFHLGNLIATGKYSPPVGEKIDLAVEYFERALDHGQTDPLLYRRLADMMYSEKKLDQAREYLAIYLTVYPYDGWSWIDLGDWSVEAGDSERAREYYRRALESEREEVRGRAEKALRKLSAD